MKEEDILSNLPDEETLALYPDEIASGKLRFKFSYRFDPGHPGGWRHHECPHPSPLESTHGNSRLVNPWPLPGKNQCPA